MPSAARLMLWPAIVASAIFGAGERFVCNLAALHRLCLQLAGADRVAGDLEGGIGAARDQRTWRRRRLALRFDFFALQAVLVFTRWETDLPFWPFICTSTTGLAAQRLSVFEM